MNIGSKVIYKLKCEKRRGREGGGLFELENVHKRPFWTLFENVPTFLNELTIISELRND